MIVCVGVFAEPRVPLGGRHVHFRDTGQIVTIVLQLLFFLTPVIYPVSLIPEEWNGIPLRALLALNPMADLVEITRALLYELRLPSCSESCSPSATPCVAGPHGLAGLPALGSRRE